MPGLLGKKIGMTSVFSADGKNVPCTVIEAGPCVVTQIKTVEKALLYAFPSCPGNLPEQQHNHPFLRS